MRVHNKATREQVSRVVDVVLGEHAAAAEWDSLQQIEVVLAVEDEFGVTIAESHIPELRNLDDVVRHLEGIGATR